MHILKITSQLYQPEWNHLSGIFQRHQAEALKKANNKVGILSSEVLPIKKFFKRYEYEKEVLINDIIILRNWERTIFPNHHVFGMLRAKQIVRNGQKLFLKYIKKSGKPDIIHCHNAVNAGYLGVYLSKEYNIPMVLTEHSSIYGRGLIDKHARSRAKYVYENSDTILSVSKAQAEVLEKQFNLSHQLEIVPNILDSLYDQELNIDHINKSDKFIFLNVGSLDENKNQKDIIIAFSKICKEGNFELRLVGQGPLESELKKLVSDYEIDDYVKFLGLMSPVEVKVEMTNANVFILNSKFETFGVVLIEALSCGCVIITTDSGGPRDIINESNGIILSSYDLDTLSTEMLNMKKNYHKYNLEKISVECRNNFGAKGFIEKISKVYEKLLS